nr:reverse transcriptase domain-containing protein [Tanacetum cinerariifolium]
ENCSAVILKKLPEKLGDPGKFLISCGFSELKCKALANLRASINLMPLSVWKKLGLPDLILIQMTLELANRAICTPDEIARDVFVRVGKFTFLADSVVVDYESDHRVPHILGRPFLRTARALIDVHGEEMSLRDGDERLTLNMKHDTTSYSNHSYRDSVNLINIFNLSSEDCLKDLVSNKQSGNPTFSLHKEIASPEVIHEFHDSKGCTFLFEELPDIDSFNDIHPHFDDDPLSGSTTYSAHSLLEEFADELALISYPLDYDDNLACDIESDIREIEFLLFQGEDFDFKDSIDQSVLTHYDDLFVDPTPEMFTDEQPPDYSFPPRFDVYPDDFLEIEFDATFDDSFDSEGEKIKEADLLIDPLDLPCDILSEESVNLINIFNLSSEDCLEDLVSHKQSGNPTFSLHKEIASPEVIHEIYDSKGCTFLSEEFPDIDSFNDIHPYFDDVPLSGSTTYSANSLLEEFADELALISYPPDYDDNHSIDHSVLTHCDDLFVNPTPEMFTDEQPPDYSFLMRFDVYPDDFLEIESDATFDDDSFDSKGENIKEAELLIDQLDLLCDILSEYDTFNSQDFSRDDVFPSPDNEDKVFNPIILIHEKLVKIITRVAKEKKLAVSYASWLFEDFDPLFYELFVFKEVPNSMRLLPFLSENEEKVFKPGIYTSKKFHCYFFSELSHP